MGVEVDVGYRLIKGTECKSGQGGSPGSRRQNWLVGAHFYYTMFIPPEVVHLDKEDDLQWYI